MLHKLWPNCRVTAHQPGGKGRRARARVCGDIDKCTYGMALDVQAGPATTVPKLEDITAEWRLPARLSERPRVL